MGGGEVPDTPPALSFLQPHSDCLGAMRKTALAAIVSILAGYALTSWVRAVSVDAGTAVALEVQGLVDGSELIVEGRVLSATGVRLENGVVATDYEVRVERDFLGGNEETVAVRIPGGILPDGSGMLLPGVPALAPGERAIVFLTEEDPRGLRMPVGLGQGRLRVLDGPGGAHWLERDASRLALVGPDGELLHPDERSLLDYAGTVAEIQAAVAIKRARAAGERDR